MKKLFALLLLFPFALAAQEKAGSLGAFDDSIGINTHLNYTNSTYANFPAVLAGLKQLGVHHIRDGFSPWPSTSPYYAQFQALKAAGISLDAVVPADATTTAAQIQQFASLTGNVEAIEYANELDAGSTAAATWTGQIATMTPVMKQAAAMLKVPLYGPAFTQAASYAQAAATGATYANLHVYFGGRYPETAGWGSTDASGHSYGSIAYWIDQAAGTPAVVTETGYNAIGCALGVKYILANGCAAFPESPYAPYTLNAGSDGAYTLRTLFSLWNAGVKRTYLYELFDEPSSPNYGIVLANGDSKRAFSDVASLMQLMNDGTNPPLAAEHGSLTYAIAGAPAGFQHTLLQARNGCFFLALWVAGPSVDATTGNPVAVPVTYATLTLPANVLQVEWLFRPFLNYKTVVPPVQAGPARTYQVPLSDQVTLLRIK